MRFASALVKVNEEKERKKEGETRKIYCILILPEHSAPYSEKMREKKKWRTREIALLRMKGFT